jgi:cell division protein FtsN
MIGPYETRDDAEQVQNELVAEGHKGVKVSERPAKN